METIKASNYQGNLEGKSVYTRRQEFERIRAQLDIERSSFKNHWKDLNDYINPRRGRFFVSDANKGDRRNLKIIDSTGTLASRTLRSGMMAGITSPSRPWFKLDVAGQGLSESEPIKKWLHDVSKSMHAMFLKSNLYNHLPVIYGDLGTFATGAMFVEKDDENILRFSALPIYSYLIGNNYKLKVDVFVRDFRMTVRQIIQQFGQDPNNPSKIDWTNISSKVKSLWLSNNPEAWIDVVHSVLPNDNWNPQKFESKYKRYISVYYEIGFGGHNTQGYYSSAIAENKFLSEKGYDYFPVLCPRWETTGEDVYGTDCPGMTSLGDIKQLQIGEKRSLQAVEKMINPSLIGPSSLRTAKVSLLPGDVTYEDVREGSKGLRPLHEVNFDIGALELKQDQVRKRISRSFYEDLFLMLAQTDRRQITAREIEERHQEKLLALGPVLEQLNQDLLDPLIDIAFYEMTQAGVLPPPPDELQGSDLKVEYISVMAEAQKLVGLGGVERFTGFISEVASVDAAVLDKINTDQLVDVYGDMTSIPPGIVRSDEAVEEMRQQRAEMQAQQAKMEQIQQAAGTAQTLSQTNTGEGNALSDILAAGEQGGMTNV